MRRHGYGTIHVLSGLRTICTVVINIADNIVLTESVQPGNEYPAAREQLPQTHRSISRKSCDIRAVTKIALSCEAKSSSRNLPLYNSAGVRSLGSRTGMYDRRLFGRCGCATKRGTWNHCQ